MHYYAINKPYGYLSQFTKENPQDLSLADLFHFPKDVYPIGRLDKDSEGLLLLTDDKKANQLILNPKNKLSKTYSCQLENIISEEAIKQLSAGLKIKVNQQWYTCRPCVVRLNPQANFCERIPPIRTRLTIPTCWVDIEISEGKNRQVRKMFAAVGFPVLRLIRISIGTFGLHQLQKSTVMELSQEEFYKIIQ